MSENSVIKAMRKILMSNTFMIIQLIIAAVFIVLEGNRNESGKDFAMIVWGDLVIGGILMLILVICEDLMTSTLPFLLISCMSIKCYDSYEVFIKYIYLAPLPVLALLFHFIVYRKKFRAGKTWPGALAVAVAVTLGGLGKISPAEYFTGSALYNTIGLGIGMLGIYFLLNTHFTETDDYNMPDRFSLLMTLIGIFCVFMIAHHYVINWAEFVEKMSPIDFQWRNNISTIMILSMPFAFYLSKKNYWFFLVGSLIYIGILFTVSRGGVISSSIELMLCLIVMIYCDKKHRSKTLFIISLAVVAILGFSYPYILKFLEPLIGRFAVGDSNRVKLFQRALEDFRSNILFGRGLGYLGNSDIHTQIEGAIVWYHSAPFQVVGSFGLVGIAAYLFQLYNRMSVIFKRISNYNLILFVSYAGLFLMSLVNPGEFCPVPYGIMATLLFILCDKNNIYFEKHFLNVNNEEITENEKTE